MMTDLEKYYNKFDEDHRLTTRHGQVEFTTTMKYIHSYIPQNTSLKILDIGAGTGRYSIALSKEGHNVTAVELVERNRKVMESKHANVNIWPGNAMDLHFLPDAKFDMTFLFGPLYHLHSHEERLKAFAEARRVTKPGGIIFAAYTMNEYSILTYCFKENHINECVAEKTITSDFHTIESPTQLYTYFRLEDIDKLNRDSGLTRIKIFAADGAADYMRQTLNAMDDEAFAHFMEFHLATCERADLLGASSHTVDVLRN